MKQPKIRNCKFCDADGVITEPKKGEFIINCRRKCSQSKSLEGRNLNKLIQEWNKIN